MQSIMPPLNIICDVHTLGTTICRGISPAILNDVISDIQKFSDPKSAISKEDNTSNFLITNVSAAASQRC